MAQVEMETQEMIKAPTAMIPEVVPELISALPKELAKLKKEIVRFHKNVMKSTLHSYANAINCGAFFLKAKDLFEHGEFRPWIENDFSNEGISVRTAQRYMSKARAFFKYLDDQGILYKNDDELKQHLDSPLLSNFVAAKSTEKSPARLTHNDANEWLSPDEVIDAVKAVMGEIDCDTCALPNEWQTDHAEINILPEQDALSRHTPWGRTNWVCPGHQVDPAAWFHRANYERTVGNLDQAILCLPESALNLPRGLFEFPVAITAEPLTVTKRVRDKEVKDKLPTRSLFVYVTAGQPDVERFARAFRDIAVAFAPVSIEG